MGLVQVRVRIVFTRATGVSKILFGVKGLGVRPRVCRFGWDSPRCGFGYLIEHPGYVVDDEW